VFLLDSSLVCCLTLDLYLRYTTIEIRLQIIIREGSAKGLVLYSKSYSVGSAKE